MRLENVSRTWTFWKEWAEVEVEVEGVILGKRRAGDNGSPDADNTVIPNKTRQQPEQPFQLIDRSRSDIQSKRRGKKRGYRIQHNKGVE